MYLFYGDLSRAWKLFREFQAIVHTARPAGRDGIQNKKMDFLLQPTPKILQKVVQVTDYMLSELN